MNNLLEYLEASVGRVPDKTAFSNGEDSLSFREVYNNARAVGTTISKKGYFRQPVVVYMHKHPDMVNAFFGVLYSGCAYVPMDEEVPGFRVKKIFETLKPSVVICDDNTKDKIDAAFFDGEILYYKDIIGNTADDGLLESVRGKCLDIDPAYIVFTSGSTGVPKGVAACHRSVIDYIETLSEVMGFSEDTVFGNQTPLYFDACLKEIYPTLKFGATAYLVPKQLFSFPVKLIEYLNEYKINTICWVVSAMTIVSGFGTFDTVKPEYLKTVAFGSEVFPARDLKIWRETLPEATFTNLYGPTEGTGMCCYYRVDRDFEPGEPIPVGGPFRNTEILLLKDDMTPATGDEEGEIFVRGTAVTLGYYNNPEKTAESFIQNPLNDHFPEIIYRTGDMAKRNERGELIFLSRKDDQIKHMGHRIELGEIEAVALLSEGIRQVCCVFKKEKNKIFLYYTGNAGEAEIKAELKGRLPRYMQPHRVVRLDEMPYTPNGKIDRRELKERS